jgi:hypothetical protein
MISGGMIPVAFREAKRFCLDAGRLPIDDD